MKKQLTRACKTLISLLVVFSMAITGLLPSYAWGGEELLEKLALDEEKTEQLIIGGGPENINGSFYNYYVNDDNTLTITGISEINDGFYGDKTVLEIPESIGGRPVVEIADYAFSDCDGITRIKLPGSVWRVGQNAFEYIETLQSIDFARVQVIGSCALEGCSSLTKLYLPNTLSEIEEGWDGAKYLGNMSALTAIDVEDGSEFYKSIDGVLYTADLRILEHYPINRSGDVFVVPDGVEEIEFWAFRYINYISTLILPHSFNNIYNDTFAHCGCIEKIYFRGCPNFNGDSLFTYNDGEDKIDNSNLCLYINDSDEGWNDLITVDGDNKYFSENDINVQCQYYAQSDLDQYLQQTFEYFRLDTNEDGEINDADTTIAVTGYSGFGGSIVIPSEIDGFTVADLIWGDGDYNFFVDNETITEITLPSSMERITNPYVITDMPNLTAIHISDNAVFYEDNGVIYGTDGGGNKMLVLYPSGRADAEYYVAEDTITIGNHAFCGANNLKRVFMPESIAFIDFRAFQRCYNLRGVYFADTGFVEVNEQAFRSGDIIENNEMIWHFDITEQVVFYIYDNHNNENHTHESGWVGDTWQNNNGVTYASSSYTDVSGDYTYYLDGDDIILTGIHDIYEADYQIPDTIEEKSITQLGSCCIHGHEVLEQLFIPDSVKVIKSDAIMRNRNLHRVEAEKLETIEGWAFHFNDNISDFVIPATVQSLDGCFIDSKCLNGYEVKWAENPSIYEIDGVVYIEKDGEKILAAYPQSYTNSSYNVEEDTTKIGSGAFGSNPYLNTVTLPGSVTSIDGSSFASLAVTNDDNSETILQIYFKGSLPDIMDWAFRCNEDNEAIDVRFKYSGWTVTDGKVIVNGIAYIAESIGDNIFYDDSGFTYIIENDTAVVIDCSKSGNVTIPATLGGKSVVAINENAFANNDRIQTIAIPTTVQSIAQSFVMNCNELSEIILYSGYDDQNELIIVDETDCLKIIDGALYTKNTSEDLDTLILIPRYCGVTRIAYGTTTIGYNAVYNSDNLYFIVPDSVTRIEREAFSGNFTAIYIDGNVNNIDIDWNAFNSQNEYVIGFLSDNNNESVFDIDINRNDKLEAIYLYNYRYNHDDEPKQTYIYYDMGEDGIQIAEYIGDYLLDENGIVNVVDDFGGMDGDAGHINVIRNAFRDKLNIKKVILPANAELYDDVFGGCHNLVEYEVVGDGRLSVHDGVLYDNFNQRLCSYPAAKVETSYRIFGTATEIQPRAFNHVKNLTELTVPAGIHGMFGAFMGFDCGGQDGFDGMGHMTVNFEGNAPEIDRWTYDSISDTEKLPTITFKEGANGFDIEDGKWTYYGNDGEDFSLTFRATKLEASTSGDFLYEVIDESSVRIVGYIGEDWYMNVPAQIDGKNVTQICNGSYNSFSEMYVPEFVESIEYHFYKIQFYRFIVDENNATFMSIDGVLYNYHIDGEGNKVADNLYLWPMGKWAITAVIPEGVSGIGGYAFHDVNGLEKVIIPASVTRIGENAFQNYYEGGDNFAQYPIRIIFAGEPCIDIAPTAFHYIKGEQQIVYRSSLSEAWYGVSYTDSNGNAISCIASNDFGDYMYDITEDNNVSISYYIGCEIDMDVEIPAEIDGKPVKELKWWSFNNSYIKSVIVPGSVEYIGGGSFCGCSHLTSITLNEGIETIGEISFQHTALTELNLPSTLTLYESGIDSSSIKNIYISDNDKYYSADGVLYSYEDNGDNLVRTLVQYPTGRSSEDESSFTIPDGINIIANSAFATSFNLEEIYVPNSVYRIEDYALGYCHALRSVYFYGGRPDIQRDAFGGTNIDELTLYYENNGSGGWDSPFIDIDGIQIKAQPILVGERDNDYTYRIENNGTPDNPDDDFAYILHYYGEANDTELGKVIIPNSLGGYPARIMGERIFNPNGDVKKVVIPATIEQIENAAFDGAWNIEEYLVEEGNWRYYADDGVLYERNHDDENDRDFITLKRYPANKNVSYFRDTQETEEIHVAAFFDVRNLRDLRFGNSLRFIGQHSFDTAEPLASITFDGSIPAIEENGIGHRELGFTMYYRRGTEGWTSPTYTDDCGVIYNTSAVDFTVKIDGNNTAIFGSQYELTLSFKDISENGIAGSTLLLTYDKNVFEYVANSIEFINKPSQGWKIESSILADDCIKIMIYDNGYYDNNDAEIFKMAYEDDEIIIKVLFDVKNDEAAHSYDNRVSTLFKTYEIIGSTTVDKDITLNAAPSSLNLMPITTIIAKPDTDIELRIISNGTTIITGIHERTKLRDVQSSFESQIKIFYPDNNEVNLDEDGDTFIGTGYKIGLADSEGNVTFMATVVVYGDVDGNGDIDGTDIIRVQQHILVINHLEGLGFIAADVAIDDKVIITDFTAILGQSKGNNNIYN